MRAMREKDMAERQRLKELSQGTSDQSGLSREERDRRATVWITTRHTNSKKKRLQKRVDQRGCAIPTLFASQRKHA